MQRKPGSDRVGSFGGQGLAPNLPPAGDVGKRNYEDRDLDIKYPPRAGEDGYKGRGEGSGWKNNRSNETEDVDDKWSKVFGKSGPKKEDQAPLRVNESRNFSSSAEGGSGSRGGFGSGDARNFGGSDSRNRDDRFSSFNRGGGRDNRNGDRYGDRERPQGDRPPFGDRERPQGDRPPFGDRERPQGDRPPFGDRERPQGDRPPFGDRERPSFGDRPAGDRPYGDRGFGGGGRGGGRGGRREQDDGSWMEDPRFAGKFGGGREGGGGGGGGYGDRPRRDDRRGDRDGDDRFAGKFGRDTNPRFADREARMSGPLPTAPKASRDAEARPDPEAVRIAAEKAAEKAAEEAAQRQAQIKQDKADKAAKRKAEEDEARRLKAEKEAAAKAAKEQAANAKSMTFAAVTDAIKAGLNGPALTANVIAAQKNISAFGATKAVLHSLNDAFTATKWYNKSNYGDLLRSIQQGNEIKTQVDIAYAVQEFCHEKGFPKLDAKSTKTLIEGLITLLLNGEVLDVEGVIAWADDENDGNVDGRVKAIVQTTALLTTLRESLIDDEEEEVEIDDDNLINAWEE